MINEQIDFLDMVVRDAVKCFNKLNKKGTDVALLNNAVDGVSFKYLSYRRQISSYLERKSNIIDPVDPNHNTKSSRY